MDNFSCFKCPELVRSRSQIVFGKKYNDYDIFIIGEAPGINEDKLGIPFIGKSGKILLDELTKNNILNYYITNIVKCRPEKNRDPTFQEISNCKTYLVAEILTHNPKILFTLGRKSTEAVYNLFGLKFDNISVESGKINEIIFKNNKLLVFPTYHPASTIFNKKFRAKFKEDIKKLSNIAGI